MQSQLGVDHHLPRIDAGPIGPVKIGLQPLATQQLDIRDHEVELKPLFVPVLHPQAGVLIPIQPRQQRTLEAVHQLVLVLPGQIRFLERQHAAGVLLGVGATVDQRLDETRIAAVKGRPLPIPLRPQQVIDRAATAPYATGMKFDDHDSLHSQTAATLSASSCSW